MMEKRSSHSSRRTPRSNHARKSIGTKRSPSGFRKNSNTKRNARSSRPSTVKRIPRKKPDATIPPAGDSIRIIPLGGVEEIGKNMTAIEYKDEIIVIDIGFQFKEEETPGIDYILPNTKYLEDRKDKIKAVLITHGHLDHIGGIPYVMPRIGNPPIYTRNLTSIMIQKRQTEFPHLAPLDIRVVEKNDKIKIGNFRVRFFSVTHTIPDSMGIIIDTPYGSIVTPGDFKLTHIDGIADKEEDDEYGVFDKENVLLMLADSTNVENPGYSTPESAVAENLEEIIRTIKGRLIIGTFASQLTRLVNVIEVCEKFGKKVVTEGRSMKTNLEVAELAGMMKVKKGTIIPVQDVDKYPPDKIVVLATGAQGEEFAALMRMANKTHKNISLTKRDTILLSASIIPGNEKAVEKLKDNIARQGTKIIHYRTSEVYIHSTGHGNKEELRWLHQKVKPKFFIPIHGNHYRLKQHGELAVEAGLEEGNYIVPDNGTIIEIQDKGTKMVALKEKASQGIVMVDGFSVGDIQEVVIRDRQMLAQDGMFVIIASINSQTGKLKKSPDIISRGFVYLRESQDLLRQTRYVIKKTIEDTTAGMKPINFDFVKNQVTDEVSKFLFQQTAKRPIVIPVVLAV